MDILFRNGQPERAVPGGSVFNALVSLSRMGLQTTFVGEAGSDEVGNLVTDFMQENGMSQDYVTRYASLPSPVSLAFLDQHNDAKYVFYKQRPKGQGRPATPDQSGGHPVIRFVLCPGRRHEGADGAPA